LQERPSLLRTDLRQSGGLTNSREKWFVVQKIDALISSGHSHRILILDAYHVHQMGLVVN